MAKTWVMSGKVAPSRQFSGLHVSPAASVPPGRVGMLAHLQSHHPLCVVQATVCGRKRESRATRFGFGASQVTLLGCGHYPGISHLFLLGSCVCRRKVAGRKWRCVRLSRSSSLPCLWCLGWFYQITVRGLTFSFSPASCSTSPLWSVHLKCFYV